MEIIKFTNKRNEIVEMTEADVVSQLVAWAESGEAMSEADMACIEEAKKSFESSFELRELVFAAMRRVPLGSDAWRRLFAIA